MQNHKAKKIKPEQVGLLEDAQDQLLSPHKINDYTVYYKKSSSDYKISQSKDSLSNCLFLRL